MASKRIGAVSVLDGDKLVGIFSERDLLTRVVVAGLDPAATKVVEVMSRNLVFGAPGDSYESCISKMQRHRCRHLPIVDGDHVVGMVSLRDLLQVELADQAEEIDHLTSYVYSVPPARLYKGN
jgi:CBS domain-containing protein